MPVRCAIIGPLHRGRTHLDELCQKSVVPAVSPRVAAPLTSRIWQSSAQTLPFRIVMVPNSQFDDFGVSHQTTYRALRCLMIVSFAPNHILEPTQAASEQPAQACTLAPP